MGGAFDAGLGLVRLGCGVSCSPIVDGVAAAGDDEDTKDDTKDDDTKDDKRPSTLRLTGRCIISCLRTCVGKKSRGINSMVEWTRNHQQKK